MEDLDREHPPIRPNRFQFIYTGTDTFWYDLNDKYDPTEALIDKIDGVSHEPSDKQLEEEQLEREKRIRDGKSMLNDLRGVRKKIIYKKFFEDKSFACIGRELKMSRQLVYYHYSKAMKFLREKYNP